MLPKFTVLQERRMYMYIQSKCTVSEKQAVTFDLRVCDPAHGISV